MDVTQIRELAFPASGEPYLLWGAILATVVFLAAALQSLRGQSQVRQRLSGSGGTQTGHGESTLIYKPADMSWLKALEPIYRPFMPSTQEVASEIRQRLTEGGLRNPGAVEMYFALRIVLALGLGICSLIVVPSLWTSLKVLPLTALACGVAGAGYLLPGYGVSWLAARRRQRILEGFPDALDMLLVCVEAGLSLEAAIQRVGQEIRNAHPTIAEEFRLVGNEMLAGKGRHDALRSLGERTGVTDVKGLASLLVQADQFGTSVARALRVHAHEMRASRILRAEERAHKIPVKLAFPLMFGLIPVVLIITLAPGIIRIVDVLMPMLSQGAIPRAR